MRKFSGQPVPDSLLDQLLQAAMSAPSAKNAQPWEFVVVTNEELLAGLREILPYGKFQAPAAIFVCGNPEKAFNPTGKRYWVQDCSAATENILLAATALGLGSCWIGIHPKRILAARVKEFLNMPPAVTPLCAVYVGFPKFTGKPKSKYDPGRIHFDRYGNQ